MSSHLLSPNCNENEFNSSLDASASPADQLTKSRSIPTFAGFCSGPNDPEFISPTKSDGSFDLDECESVVDISPAPVLLENSEEETDEQRVARELRESEEYAWELMRAESMETYQMQMQYIQDNANDMSEEDRQALEMMMRESGYEEQQAVEDGEEEFDDEEGDDAHNDSNPDNWSYDRLLQFGEAVGDVKTERWRITAKDVMKEMPRIPYSHVQKLEKGETLADSTFPYSSLRHDERCSICMDSFGVCTSSPELAAAAAAAAASIQQRNKAFQPNTEGTDGQNDSVPLSVFQFGATAQSTSAVAADLDAVTAEPSASTPSQPLEEVMVAVFPCRHYFHSSCADMWIKDHNSCPNCKNKVMPSP